jgi:hypothetical protein
MEPEERPGSKLTLQQERLRLMHERELLKAKLKAKRRLQKAQEEEEANQASFTLYWSGANKQTGAPSKRQPTPQRGLPKVEDPSAGRQRKQWGDPKAIPLGGRTFDPPGNVAVKEVDQDVNAGLEGVNMREEAIVDRLDREQNPYLAEEKKDLLEDSLDHEKYGSDSFENIEIDEEEDEYNDDQNSNDGNENSIDAASSPRLVLTSAEHSAVIPSDTESEDHDVVLHHTANKDHHQQQQLHLQPHSNTSSSGTRELEVDRVHGADSAEPSTVNALADALRLSFNSHGAVEMVRKSLTFRSMQQQNDEKEREKEKEKEREKEKEKEKSLGKTNRWVRELQPANENVTSIAEAMRIENESVLFHGKDGNGNGNGNGPAATRAISHASAGRDIAVATSMSLFEASMEEDEVMSRWKEKKRERQQQKKQNTSHAHAPATTQPFQLSVEERLGLLDEVKQRQLLALLEALERSEDVATIPQSMPPSQSEHSVSEETEPRATQPELSPEPVVEVEVEREVESAPVVVESLATVSLVSETMIPADRPDPSMPSSVAEYPCPHPEVVMADNAESRKEEEGKEEEEEEEASLLSSSEDETIEPCISISSRPDSAVHRLRYQKESMERTQTKGEEPMPNHNHTATTPMTPNVNITSANGTSSIGKSGGGQRKQWQRIQPLPAQSRLPSGEDSLTQADPASQPLTSLSQAPKGRGRWSARQRQRPPLPAEQLAPSIDAHAPQQEQQEQEQEQHYMHLRQSLDQLQHFRRSHRGRLDQLAVTEREEGEEEREAGEHEHGNGNGHEKEKRERTQLPHTEQDKTPPPRLTSPPPSEEDAFASLLAQFQLVRSPPTNPSPMAAMRRSLSPPPLPHPLSFSGMAATATAAAAAAAAAAAGGGGGGGWNAGGMEETGTKHNHGGVHHLSPQLPLPCRRLSLHCLTTWGDPHYLGLNGLDVWNGEGQPLPIRHLSLGPGSSPLPPADPRQLSNCLDGVNVTCDQLHTFLCPMQSPVIIHMDLVDEGDLPVTVAIFRCFNLNTSRIEAFSGVKDAQLWMDDQLVWQGEIKRAPGVMCDSWECSTAVYLSGREEDRQRWEGLMELRVLKEREDRRRGKGGLEGVGEGEGEGAEEEEEGGFIQRPLTAEKDPSLISEHQTPHHDLDIPLNYPQQDETMTRRKSDAEDAERVSLTVTENKKEEEEVVVVEVEKEAEMEMEMTAMLSSLGTEMLVDTKEGEYSPGGGETVGEYDLIPGLLHCGSLQIELRSTWGDTEYLGLSALAITTADGAMYRLPPESISCSTPPVMRYSLESLLRGGGGEGMWSLDSPATRWLVYAPALTVTVTIRIPPELQQLGILSLWLWNYTGKSADAYERGARFMHLSADGQRLTPPGEGLALRCAPPLAEEETDPSSSSSLFLASSYPNYGQEFCLLAHVRQQWSAHTALLSHCHQLQRSQPGIRQGHIYAIPIPLPYGTSFSLHCLSTWGDPHYIGLSSLRLYSYPDFVEIHPAMHAAACFALPAGIQVLPEMRQDPRTLDKLFTGNVHDAGSRQEHGWLAPYTPNGAPVVIHFWFHQPIPLAALRLWNYQKTPNRGVRNYEIRVDGATVYTGICRKAALRAPFAAEREDASAALFVGPWSGVLGTGTGTEEGEEGGQWKHSSMQALYQQLKQEATPHQEGRDQAVAAWNCGKQVKGWQGEHAVKVTSLRPGTSVGHA